MNNKWIYIGLYYICIIITAILYFCFVFNNIEFVYYDILYNLVLYINVALIGANTILFIANRLKKANIFLPLLYCFFFIIVLIIAYKLNNKTLYKDFHYIYYSKFILINLLFVNIYTLLSIEKKIKVNNTLKDINNTN